MSVKVLRGLLLALPIMFLGGCNLIVLQPSGDIALQQRDLLIASTVLMLFIIVPVMIAIAVIGYRYRESNQKSSYAPDWEHSTKIELLIWAAPLAIIVALGAMTWIGTHTLDPFRPLERINAKQAAAADKPALNVEVVALDWKWLFFYPDYGIATVNQMAAPVDVPIHFRITASDVMNSFYIPALAGQIMAMPAMETQLFAVINKPGDYQGISANYSGAGFSGMNFQFLGKSEADFQRWIQDVKSGGGSLTREQYQQTLAQPSSNVPVMHYAQVAPDLYSAILNRCVDSSKICVNKMMAIDAQGGVPLKE